MTDLLVTACGPPVWTSEVIDEVLSAGVRRFRVTPAFRSREANCDLVNELRSAAARLAVDISIYLDASSGAKLRLLTEHAIAVQPGDTLTLANRAGPGEVAIERPLPDAVQRGSMLVVGDADVDLRVIGRSPGRWTAEVLRGGVIKPRKALSSSDVDCSLGAVNPQNRAELELAAELELEYVVLSFVRSPDDIDRCREFLGQWGGDEPRVVSKIETSEALDDLEAIVAASDEVMVARGDLAIQLPFELLGLIEWHVLETCREAETPCIVATQLIESVVDRRIPSRAEVLDVSMAAALGARSIMLGPETCQNPELVRAITTTASILQAVDGSGVVMHSTSATNGLSSWIPRSTASRPLPAEG